MQDSREVGQLSDPKIRHQARLAHDEKLTTDAPPLHDHQRRPDDGQLGTPVGFQLIPSTSSTTTQTPVA